MAKEKNSYLKITRPDKTVHFSPVENKHKLDAQNSLRKPQEKFKIETVELTDEELANHLDYDPKHTTVGGDNLSALQKKLLESKEAENDDLKKQIAELMEANKAKVVPKAVAADVVVAINAATSPEEVNELVGDDTRLAVTKAAAAKLAALAVPKADETSL